MHFRILLAGGNHNFQQAVAQTLMEEQIETICADDGWTALCLLNENLSDVLVADMNLPDKNGVDLCRYVRGEPEFRSLPVVLFDSHFSIANQTLALIAGADVYLSEPVAPGELARLVRKLLPEEERDDAPVIAELQSFVPAALAIQPPAQRSTYLVVWALLAVAILITIGLALQERRYTPGYSAISDPTGVGIPSDIVVSALTAQQPEDSSQQQATNLKTGVIIPAAASDAGTVGSQGEVAKTVRPTPSPDNPAAATKEQNVDQKGRTPAQPPRPMTPRNDTPFAGSNQPTQSSPPAARHRPLKNTYTIRGHLQKSGEEMKEAGEHFGSSAKHVGQSGGQFAVWAGKKMGRGVKSIGMALSKIF